MHTTSGFLHEERAYGLLAAAQLLHAALRALRELHHRGESLAIEAWLDELQKGRSRALAVHGIPTPTERDRVAVLDYGAKIAEGIQRRANRRSPGHTVSADCSATTRSTSWRWARRRPWRPTC